MSLSFLGLAVSSQIYLEKKERNILTSQYTVNTMQTITTPVGDINLISMKAHHETH